MIAMHTKARADVFETSKCWTDTEGAIRHLAGRGDVASAAELALKFSAVLGHQVERLAAFADLNDADLILLAGGMANAAYAFGVDLGREAGVVDLCN